MTRRLTNKRSQVNLGLFTANINESYNLQRIPRRLLCVLKLSVTYAQVFRRYRNIDLLFTKGCTNYDGSAG